MAPAVNKILVINTGSATLKFKIFAGADKRAAADAMPRELVTGIVERIGLTDSFIEVTDRAGQRANLYRQTFPAGVPDHGEALVVMAKVLKNYWPQIAAVGHRVVHGGEEFVKTTALNSAVVEKLARYNQLAPLHNPINLVGIKKARALLPEVKQFAVFDTAYYRTMPDYIYRYPLPEKFYRDYGVRRYGFHGISHEYAAIEGARQLKKSPDKLKIITLHLGSGCSMTATLNGRALATTMGFTPLEGLMMATRCGDLDASAPLFLAEEAQLSSAAIRQILNSESGLLAMAGTRDMREILAAAGQKVTLSKNEKNNALNQREFTAEEKIRAKLALKMFVYHIVRYIGQFYAILKGLDLLVFTGGIGERSPAVRQLILREIKHFKPFETVVIPANEELMIAQEGEKALKRGV